MFLHIYRLCPGSGSRFVSLHKDPDPTFIIQIRIYKSGSTNPDPDPHHWSEYVSKMSPSISFKKQNQIPVFYVHTGIRVYTVYLPITIFPCEKCEKILVSKTKKDKNMLGINHSQHLPGPFWNLRFFLAPRPCRDSTWSGPGSSCPDSPAWTLPPSLGEKYFYFATSVD